MEGVTDPVYRGLVLGLHRPEDLGGAFTEFLRISQRPAKTEEVARHMGPSSSPIPVGLQLMGSDRERMADSARAAIRAGAVLVDINFGCPAKGALKGCAGSGMLQDPGSMESMVKAIADAVREESGDRVPVTGKIRAGYNDANSVADLARAVEQGGAQMLTVHCRTRAEGYCPEVDWTRLATAAQAVGIPVCANGGIESHADLDRARQETGCSFAMIGRAALGNPWIFSGEEVSTQRAAQFLVDYWDAIVATPRGHARAANGKVKQLLRLWSAGDLVPDAEARTVWLRETDAPAQIARLRSITADTESHT
ncbi:MAG: tRNA-dihydrouridine synthase family protein [Sulfitobacter sp.]|nr:tRNA-dihydrouridine synthase family protein [Sulfitobacter sp.]